MINTNTLPKIYIALPVINELENIPTFLNDLKAQTYQNFELYVCVNQPDNWWEDPVKTTVCIDNQKTIELLKEQDFFINIIDKSTKGNAWTGKQSGVGWARKVLMDTINNIADKAGIIISLDADTRFNSQYFESIINTFVDNPKAVAIANPYYHKLTDDDAANRAILRYEIYMRHYSINLFRINCPYNFTALGSAMALPVWAYRKIGGITPMKSGEDFYFLQKLTKTGQVVNYNKEKVYPAARFSDRVFFGTGPAMIKGRSGDWNSYPIYYFSLFDAIKRTYELLPSLFYDDIELPMSAFLSEQFNDDKWWVALRNNFKTERHFVKACCEKIDGLRILQYLKANQALTGKTNEECLIDFFDNYLFVDAIASRGGTTKQYNKNKVEKDCFTSFAMTKELCENELNIDFDSFNFDKATTTQLNDIRDLLCAIEEEFQHNKYKL